MQCERNLAQFAYSNNQCGILCAAWEGSCGLVDTEKKGCVVQICGHKLKID